METVCIGRNSSFAYNLPYMSVEMIAPLCLAVIVPLHWDRALSNSEKRRIPMHLMTRGFTVDFGHQCVTQLRYQRDVVEACSYITYMNFNRTMCLP